MTLGMVDCNWRREASSRWLLAALALAAAASLLYVGALGHEYVWDDLLYLGSVRYYRGFEGAVRALSEPFFVTY
ncbi:MAG: hypothetical protein IJR28_05860, partial [Ottowia sp.]|nr:hypothetical protein [Ottowia sp.]